MAAWDVIRATVLDSNILKGDEMTYMMIRHKVKDYDVWKPGYDGHLSSREAAGLREVHLLRNINDPQEVVALFEVSDLEKARAFAASEDLKLKMQEVGVMDRPDISYLEG
jgi:hypothetical protein